MTSKQHRYSTTCLNDYQPPSYFIETVDLTFELNPQETIVTAVLQCRRNPAVTTRTLVLQGEELRLLSLLMNERELTADDYELDDEQLTIHDPSEAFNLTIKTMIQPQLNTALSGLYQSNDLLCTQCEAHGFRRITYFLDRPDVMARYKTTIIADKQNYPVLLSNGNRIAQTELDDNRQQVTWEDPFKKPCYLFALVAGDLAVIEDQFITCSGREVALKIFVEHGNRDKCQHAMQSLKQAMKWDEDVYGREYDLDTFMIVAVNDFNAGAMENKGLNIFNAKYILANPDIATDQDYENVQSVVAHEYFHNWTGNRITCRDWFQLSLKEGLTVFRDQEFTRDMNSKDVNRIHDVQLLWNHQFAEDAGPMAHPVQPDSYVEVNNFYTATIYNKGAEVVRMMHTMLGVDGFRKGMDVYFSLYDGQAVTIEEFVGAMERANSIDLSQFRRWYHQSGTPHLTIATQYFSEEKAFELSIKQSCPVTPGQPHKEPFQLPFSMALLDKKGREMPLRLMDEQEKIHGSKIVNITQAHQVLRFVDVNEQPVVSLLRDFSAPVKVSHDLTRDELLFLLANDSNGFARWDAGQTLMLQTLFSLIDQVQNKQPLTMDSAVTSAYASVLSNSQLDPALKAKILLLPDEKYIAELVSVIDAQAIHDACQFMRLTFAKTLQDEFLAQYQQLSGGEYNNSAQSRANRQLKNGCLVYLAQLATPEMLQLCMQQFSNANNMTDSIAALEALSHHNVPERQQALDAFYKRWSTEAIVIDKWLSVQARSQLPTTLDAVKNLLQHEAFSMTNPNKVRSLLGSFAQANPARFHHDPQASYPFYTQQIITLDSINSQVAAILVTPYTHWQRWQQPQQEAQKQQLETILAQKNLSTNVHEVVEKSLKN